MTTITTIDARNNSPRLGQETLFISASTEIKKSAKRGMFTTRNAAQPPMAMTAAGMAYRLISVVAASLSLQAPIATAARIAKNVIWRAILPWLRLYREPLNIPAINSATFHPSDELLAVSYQLLASRSRSLLFSG